MEGEGSAVSPEPIFPPARSKALFGSLGSLFGLGLGSLGFLREPARSNAETLSDSLESWVSAAGVAFGARVGSDTGFCATLVVRAGVDAEFCLGAGVWAEEGWVVDACCWDGFDRANMKITPMIAATITTAAMARSGQGLNDFGGTTATGFGGAGDVTGENDATGEGDATGAGVTGAGDATGKGGGMAGATADGTTVAGSGSTTGGGDSVVSSAATFLPVTSTDCPSSS